jgi:FkbH-like protein
MYESEANNTIETADQVPPEVISLFGELKGKITARTVFPWSEHCTECVWPTCYSSCELYSPREDKRCRRFIDGMVRIDCPSVFNSYLLKVRFKRWGKLWAPGNNRLSPIAEAEKIERRDYRIGTVINQLLWPAPLKRFAIEKRYSFKKKMAQRQASGAPSPSCFLLECYNPANRAIQLSLTIRSVDERSKIPFQELIEVRSGFNRIRIPYDRVSAAIDFAIPFHIELIPNEVADGTTLYFGVMDFVQEAAAAADKRPKIKCIVWDLDNTLWDGILVEDGPAKLRLKPGIAEIIRELDRHGVLNSIASKNNAEEALQVLKQFQLADYFLCPQISWRPKSEGIQEIARHLNIGSSTLLFVDDSEFELEQVKAVCPDVQILNAQDYLKLLQIPEYQAPVTDEGASRRQMYRLDEKRKVVAEGFGQDYMAFLKHCNIRLTIRSLSEQNLERVHELTQRTNQMNFSGNRYDRDTLRKILSARGLDTYVLNCEDRFGSYGVIGFSVVDRDEPRMTDLMFSCRIQSKRVEHAFLGWVIGRYLAESTGGFFANYRRTPRNAPSGRVFEDLGMEIETVSDGISSHVFRKDQSLPDDQVIQITFAEEPVSAV